MEDGTRTVAVCVCGGSPCPLPPSRQFELTWKERQEKWTTQLTKQTKNEASLPANPANAPPQHFPYFVFFWFAQKLT